jgi:hypothetical protein
MSDIIEKINAIEKFQRERTSGRSEKPQWPSQEKVNKLKTRVKRVLEAIGAKGSYISDVTLVGDFEGVWGITEETSSKEAAKIVKKKCKEVAEKLGLDAISAKDYIFEIAQRLPKEELAAEQKKPEVTVEIVTHDEPIQIGPGFDVILPKKRTCGNGGCGCR